MLQKKIILPGGAGLVGQNLIVQLKRKGYNNLVVLDKHLANLNILKKLHPDVTTVHVDLAEAGKWETHFADADVVIMLQAQIGGLYLDPFIRNNITATQNILAVIKKYTVPYTVHISSSVVNSIANDHYTNTKKTQEKLVIESDTNWVILRPTLMFGWFDRKHLGWLARFMQKFPIFPIPGNGRFLRQPLYEGDFCKIIISCIENPIHKKIYNISGLEKINYIDIIQEIKQITHSSCKIIKIPYSFFYVLLKTWAIFDKNPPFTAAQLKALVARDEFEIIDWPGIFAVQPTEFSTAVKETFTDPTYSKIKLEF